MDLPQETWLTGILGTLRVCGGGGLRVSLRAHSCPGTLWNLVSLSVGLAGCAEPSSTLQDYIFYLEPERLESGKGKCPYDPKLDTASALISEFLYSILVLWRQYVAFTTRMRRIANRVGHVRDHGHVPLAPSGDIPGGVGGTVQTRMS